MRDELVWRLLYTKPRAESWSEINLQQQGFATFLPRVRHRSRVGLLYPRYIFTGHNVDRPIGSLSSTLGVLYVVRYGSQPARVPVEVIEEIRARMDADGMVRLDEEPRADPLFSIAERERLRALERLVQAGFRVRMPQSSCRVASP